MVNSFLDVGLVEVGEVDQDRWDQLHLGQIVVPVQVLDAVSDVHVPQGVGRLRYEPSQRMVLQGSNSLGTGVVPDDLDLAGFAHPDNPVGHTFGGDDVRGKDPSQLRMSGDLTFDNVGRLGGRVLVRVQRREDGELLVGPRGSYRSPPRARTAMSRQG